MNAGAVAGPGAPASGAAPGSASGSLAISAQAFDAVIFDLDGVVTRTASLHARAWQQAFDQFLCRHAPGQPPFDPQADYRRFVDGRPREDGVRHFLRSRGIELPEGHPGDPPGRATVQGLAARKNALFQQLLADPGAEVFESTLALLRALRQAGLRTAVVSASRNAAAVLASVKANELFDARVDGVVAQRDGLAGKPAPDTFLAAARLLGVPPRRCVLVEDALAGVQAGRAGGFGLVVGVDRANQAEALRAHGADVVLQDLAELRVEAPTVPPDALQALPQIVAAIGRRHLALFLDYDGTLTPIVERPELAVLADEVRAVLHRLAALCTLAVISGRDLPDVRERVGVPGIACAGSHGFDIDAPGAGVPPPPEAAAAVPELDAAEAWLRERLAPLPGALLERKRYGLAVHYRMVDPALEGAVAAAVDEALQRCRRLRRTHGKKVFELLPDVDWHKGAALQRLREQLGRQLGRQQGEHPAGMLSIYIGDDVTDEDAFRALAGDDIGIVVMAQPRATAARYRLASPRQVALFLEALADEFERGRRHGPAS